MRRKYIEEVVGQCFLFPEGPTVSDIAIEPFGYDLAEKVPTQSAKRILADRDRLINALIFAIEFDDKNEEAIFDGLVSMFRPFRDGEE